MGAVFFAVLLAILFFTAVFFIAVSIIIIAIWKARKRKGKNPKKWWRIVPTVLLIINVVIALIPIGYIGFLRYVNASNRPDIVNVESRGAVYWPSTDNGWTTAWFEMDDKKYIALREGFSNEPFFLDCGKESLGEPIANLRIRPSDSDDAFNNFMWILLSGSTYAEQNVSTLYTIKNENDFDLIYAANSPGSATVAGGAFCEEESLKEAKRYYSDISNYDTLNLLCTYKDVEKTIRVTAGTFERLWAISSVETDVKRVQIPENIEERWVKVYSKDRLVSRHISLSLIGHQVYTVHTVSAGYMTGCLLSPDINQYVIDSIFVR